MFRTVEFHLNVYINKLLGHARLLGCVLLRTGGEAGKTSNEVFRPLENHCMMSVARLVRLVRV